jgi:hypothetical protein
MIRKALPMARSSDGLFILFFRSVYLSMIFGFAAFTCLGFAQLGTNIGLIATIVVALASEISFVHEMREEEENEWKDERHMV